MMKGPLLGAALRRNAATSPIPDVLWWKLNEGSGTSITGDATNGGDDGVTDAAWLTGKSGGGYCADFNGTSQDAASSAAITYGTNKITVCFWAYFDSTSGTTILLESSANWNSNNNSWICYLDSGRINAGVRDSAGRVEYVTAPSTGAWVHIALLLDNSTTTGNVDIYYDGVSQSTTVSTNSKTSIQTFSAYTLYAAARARASLWSNFRMDDLRIYSGDKTAFIAAIMADAQ